MERVDRKNCNLCEQAGRPCVGPKEIGGVSVQPFDGQGFLDLALAREALALDAQCVQQQQTARQILESGPSPTSWIVLRSTP